MASSSIISSSVFTLALVLGISGCSGDDATISLDTSQSKLTDAAGDALFKVKLDEAPDDGYAPDALIVKVTFDDKATAVTCVAGDGNTDGKIGQGDWLDCNEGTTNVFDATFAGKAGKVELFAKSGSEEELVGETEWKP